MNQSSINSNFTPSRSLNSSFSRSTPTPITTYAEFQSSRTEKFDQQNDDLRIQKERRIKELQEQLETLTLEVNAAQASLAAEERDFLEQQESLITQLNRIKIDAEVKAEECRMDHLSKLEMLFTKHSNAVREVTQQIEESASYNNNNNNSINNSNNNNPELSQSKQQLRSFEQSLRDLKSSHVDDRDEADEADQQMYSQKISELEKQRKELINEFKTNQASHKSKIVELTLALDDQDTSYQKEISSIQKSMQDKENQYQQQLEKCFRTLSSIQERRANVVSQRREKVTKLQNEIKEIQHEFHRKMQDTTRIAEKLRTALVNVNLKKSQQLQVEKDASLEQSQLLKENYALQQQLYQLQKQLAGCKEEFSVLRKELSATIGPRRTASIFF